MWTLLLQISNFNWLGSGFRKRNYNLSFSNKYRFNKRNDFSNSIKNIPCKIYVLFNIDGSSNPSWVSVIMEYIIGPFLVISFIASLTSSCFDKSACSAIFSISPWYLIKKGLFVLVEAFDLHYCSFLSSTETGVNKFLKNTFVKLLWEITYYRS